MLSTWLLNFSFQIKENNFYFNYFFHFCIVNILICLIRFFLLQKIFFYFYVPDMQ